MSIPTTNSQSGSLPARQFMTETVHTVAPDTTLGDAASAMRTHDIGFLPVVDASGPIGVITDRDLAVRGAGRGLDPAVAVALDVMTPNVASVPTGQGIEHVVQVMRDRRIRRVLVVDDGGQVAGVISLGDLVAHDLPAAQLAQALGAVAT